MNSPFYNNIAFGNNSPFALTQPNSGREVGNIQNPTYNFNGAGPNTSENLPRFGQLPIQNHNFRAQSQLPVNGMSQFINQPNGLSFTQPYNSNTTNYGNNQPQFNQPDWSSFTHPYSNNNNYDNNQPQFNQPGWSSSTQSYSNHNTNYGNPSQFNQPNGSSFSQPYDNNNYGESANLNGNRRYFGQPTSTSQWSSDSQPYSDNNYDPNANGYNPYDLNTDNSQQPYTNQSNNNPSNTNNNYDSSQSNNGNNGNQNINNNNQIQNLEFLLLFAALSKKSTATTAATTSDSTDTTVSSTVGSAGSSGNVWGDPHFVTARGDKFDVQGQAGNFYNIISDTGLNVNAKFDTIASHPGTTVMSQVGIKTNKDQLEFDFDKATPTLNGTAMDANKAYTIDGGTATWDGGLWMTVTNGEHTTKIWRDTGDGFMDVYDTVGANGNLTDGNPTDGLLGQMEDNGTTKRIGQDQQGKGAINGTAKDYQESSLFSNSATFSAFDRQTQAKMVNGKTSGIVDSKGNLLMTLDQTGTKLVGVRRIVDDSGATHLFLQDGTTPIDAQGNILKTA